MKWPIFSRPAPDSGHLNESVSQACRLATIFRKKIASAQRGKPQPNFHHEGLEDHEEKSCQSSQS
jgi:hypothetical protein